MIISIIGYPYSGKSMLTNMLSKRFNIRSFSTGEFIRDCGVGTADVEQFKQFDLSLTYNDLVNEEVMKRVNESGGNLILDGYPRSMDQCLRMSRWGLETLVIWIYSNPLSILDRLNVSTREGRMDEDVEVMKGRIKASESLLEIIKRECIRNGWHLLQYTFDHHRMKQIIQEVNQWIEGARYAEIHR